ncbi:dephospho-CoA kinase [Chryseotalea sanaruensis]|uniref:Dephospho-CoA kinase n=1 Tax=Chryseotalea sanaruensis TaxID=2482724 RepID=A0A401U7Q0_9BACT|nr:dephospho-CoA kinase [Chryseotalea sanaruensis]GCC50906.1 dephospho-CoA kinase [Chryseotalea sanaruensis]
MIKPLQIGITGGIGAGKSTVCKIFNVLGIPTYDADSRAKALMTTDGILMEGIKKEFGTLSFKTSGELNREYLATEVFSDEQKLKKLNSLVHPRVGLDYENWLKEQIGAPYVLKEAALLIESGSYKTLDYLLLVTAPEHERIERVLARDKHRNREQVKEIIKNQLSETEKITLADFIINNDGNHSLLEQVLKLHDQFLRTSKREQ